MSILPIVTEEVANWTLPIEIGAHIVVPTFALYPSNAAVQVFIEGGSQHFVVSDGGGALAELHGVGGHSVRAMRYLREATAHHDMTVNKSGWIYCHVVRRDMLTTAISLVADASKAAAVNLLRHFRPEIDYNFKRDFDNFLELKFSKYLERNGKLVGASNKPHNFDYVIDVGNVGKIVVDAVTPDANSINSAIVAHLDLKAANRDGVRQVIVYDDRVNWRSADLALLRVGAPPIGYSDVENAFPGVGYDKIAS